MDDMNNLHAISEGYPGASALEIHVIDFDDIPQRENDMDLKSEIVYSFAAGEHNYNMRKLSIPNQFQFFRPYCAQIDSEKMMEFLDQYLDSCIQYINQTDVDELPAIYEYTAKLNKDETEITVHAFPEKDDPFDQLNHTAMNKQFAKTGSMFRRNK